MLITSHTDPGLPSTLMNCLLLLAPLWSIAACGTRKEEPLAPSCSLAGCELSVSMARGVLATCREVADALPRVRATVGLVCGVADRGTPDLASEECSQCPAQPQVLREASRLLAAMDGLDTSGDGLQMSTVTVYRSKELAKAIGDYYHVRELFNLIGRRESGEVVAGSSVQDFASSAEDTETGLAVTAAKISEMLGHVHQLIGLDSWCREAMKGLKVLVDIRMMEAVAMELRGSTSQGRGKDGFVDSFQGVMRWYTKAC